MLDDSEGDLHAVAYGGADGGHAGLAQTLRGRPDMVIALLSDDGREIQLCAQGR